MSSVSPANMVVEHVVLIQVKENTPPEKISAMESAILSLNSLPMVDNLSVSPLTILSTHGEDIQETLKFTHALHGRFANKQALAEYSADPRHVAILRNDVLPITSDILAVDWEAQPSGLSDTSTYGALRIQLFSPKADLDEASKGDLTEAMKGYTDFGQLSFGDNFSPPKANGFSLGSLILFEGVQQMENLISDEEDRHGSILQDVTSYVDKSLVFQYALNPPYHA